MRPCTSLRARRRAAAVALVACGLATVSAPSLARAFTSDVGDVSVLEDVTGAIHDTEGFWGPDKLCREAAKRFFPCHADEYDILVAFDAKPVDGIEGSIRNVQQGTPVKNDIDGIGYPRYDNTRLYGSAGRLQHCVSMASLSSIPDSPDGPATVFFGLPLGITGVELLGHELGHKWLLGVRFDKNDGRGEQHFLRGYENDSPNLHYAAYTGSGSVMYGNFITQNTDGTYRVCGGERGYGALDQYLMGLRPPNEVPPLLVLSDGSGQGSPAVPNSRGTCSNVSGQTRVDVAIEDIQRVMGARSPAYPNAQRAWKVGFLLVTEQGLDATPAQIAKVDAYRRRFEQWFAGATGNRGSVDTRLGPRTCAPDDGGAPRDGGLARDGGKPAEDAGASGPADAGSGGGAADDAGVAGDDAGWPGGVADAGPAGDGGGGAARDGGAADGGAADGGRRTGAGGVTGCSCEAARGHDGAAGGLVAFVLGALWLARFRRRGPRRRAG